MTAIINVTFLTEWHCGSGTSGGADLDLTVLRDEDALPYVPARTFKGLLREQMEYVDPSILASLFGTEGDLNGDLLIDDLLMTETDAMAMTPDKRKELFRRVVSTKLENGIAVNRSLRAIEYVVPMTLLGHISFPDKYYSQIKEAAGMIKAIGMGKNKGFGSCTVTLEDCQ